MEKILTPIQQAIEEIKVFRKKASFEYRAAITNEDKEEWLSSISAIDSCLDLLKTHLPKEQEAIEEAHLRGDINGCSLSPNKKATEYFTNKYGKTNT